jgi:hypothetical protein
MHMGYSKIVFFKKSSFLEQHQFTGEAFYGKWSMSCLSYPTKSIHGESEITMGYSPLCHHTRLIFEDSLYEAWPK